MGRVEARIADLLRQIEEDQRRLADQSEVADVAQRAQNLSARAEELHRRVEEAQTLEVSNREAEGVARSVEADLKTKGDQLERSRVESAELATVPCGGQGAYATCVKIRRAIQARQELPVLEGVGSTLALELELQPARCPGPTSGKFSPIGETTSKMRAGTPQPGSSSQATRRIGDGQGRKPSGK